MSIASAPHQQKPASSPAQESKISKTSATETGLDSETLAALEGTDVAEHASDELLAMVPRPVMKAQKMIPVEQSADVLTVAAAAGLPGPFRRLLEKKFSTGVLALPTTEETIASRLRRFESGMPEAATFRVHPRGSDAEDDSAVKLVDSLLSHSMQSEASDIHIEPGPHETLVRERIDGLLRKYTTFSKSAHERLTQRIKVLANLATDEHAVPQDGKLIYWTPDRKRVDVRVSIVPTTHGEKICLRLLAAHGDEITLESIGCQGRDRKILEEESKRSWGMLLVTGPTGSGKSTSLYTILKRLNTDTVNLSTIEDPVEYEIPGGNQIQVNEKTGLTFATGLRALVRQDPNIILVGEIRDRDTANIAVNAAMTGHLVLSTLHTNTAATAIPRLVDMGVEQFLIASMVNVVVGQRLIRNICPHCRETREYKTSELTEALAPELLKKLSHGEALLRLATARGCDSCNGTGFKGRTGIFEVMHVDSELRKLILAKATAETIQEQAVKDGMTTMIEDGLEKVRQGVTTLEELLRVIRS